jgi:predicted signal transduction protein with EAL and GGDEF domain
VQPGELSGATEFFVAFVTGVDFVVGAFGLLVFIRRPQRATGLFALGLLSFAIADVGATFRADLDAAVPAVACALYCIAMTGFAVGARTVVPEPADGDDMRRDLREASVTIVITAVVVTAALIHVAVYRRVPTLPPIVFTVLTILAFFVRHLADHAQRGDLFARLRSQLVTDPLTGVSTRYVLDDLDAQRAPSTLDVIVVGVEGVGRLNRSKGHAEGDALLVRVGGALRDGFPDALAIVRVDSDEFVIVADRADVPIEAAVLARDLTHEAAIATLDTSVRVRATVGVASGQMADRDVFDVIARSQRARHLATTTPGISVRMYDDAMLARDDRDRFIDARLPKAIERGDITVHFQPIVLLATGRVVAVESLARWTDPLLGVVNPVEFIGRAEATGHIDALGLSILRQAARAAVSLGLPARQIAMGVNVSASQLRRHHAGRGFADDVATILAECGLPPDLLAIEVTESMLVEEHGPAVGELHRLHSMGVQIVIDDFGSGHWALGYFRWLTADVVKIDRSLIATLADDERSRAVVASIVDLGRRIGMETIAEGVEDDDVAATAAHLGVNALQGWNYARAVPYDDLVRTIDQLDARADAIRMAAGIAPVPARAEARVGS